MRAAGRPALLGAFAALALAVAACGDGDGSGTPTIAVTDAYIPAPAATNGALYLEITNDGDAADRLVGVTTDVADVAEIHETVTGDDGLTRMQPVEEIVIEAGETVALEPGALHVMLLGISELEEGDTVQVVLELAESGSVEVEADVVAAGASSAHDGH